MYIVIRWIHWFGLELHILLHGCHGYFFVAFPNQLFPWLLVSCLCQPPEAVSVPLSLNQTAHEHPTCSMGSGFDLSISVKPRLLQQGQKQEILSPLYVYAHVSLPNLHFPFHNASFDPGHGTKCNRSGNTHRTRRETEIRPWDHGHSKTTWQRNALLPELHVTGADNRVHSLPLHNTRNLCSFYIHEYRQI